MRYPIFPVPTEALRRRRGSRSRPSGRHRRKNHRLSLLDNAETKTYSYSPNTNRLTQVGSKEVTLDAAGNTVSDRNGKRRFEYLASGRLFKVYKERKQVATYLYNAQSQRTQKITKQGTTLYHYDLNGQLIAETAKDGTLQRAYVWLDNLPLAQIDVKGKEHEHRRKPRKERITYLHTDHLGTPRLATDANQQVVWRWDSDAFGSEKPEHEDEETDDHKDITVNLRFAGQYFDRETQLTYNGARYVDKHGRFITTDPMSVGAHVQRWQANLGAPGQPPLELNSFARVANNPLRWIDPEGLRTVPPGPKDPSRPPSGKEKQLTNPKSCTNKPTYEECLICCGTIAGQIGTTGSIGTACAEHCARKEGITKNDQQQCSATTRDSP